MTNFTALDWGIVGVYLVGISVAGWLCRTYIRGMADFTVAGRTLRPYLAAATLIGSELGLITVMYSAQKGFTGGFSVFHMAVSAFIVTLFIGLSGFIVVPLRRMGVMTIPEYYERRFGRGVRVLGGLLLALAGILNMGLFLKAGALFVTGITGMEPGTTLNIVMTVMLLLVLGYTIVGGMLSVVVTDYIQFLVLSVGMLVACALAVNHLGWDTITETVLREKGAAGVNPFHTPPTEPGKPAIDAGATYVIWMAFLGIVSAAVWQTAVMRACSAASIAAVKRLYLLSAVGFMIRFLIPYFLGIAAFVYFAGDQTLRAEFLVDDPETTLRAMPVFLGKLLPVGLVGLVAAGMLAAFMSTHDSYLLCWSSVLTQDVVAPLGGDKLTDRQRVTWTRCFIFGIGVFLLVWSLWYPLQQDLWDYMALTGAIYFTGAFAVLALGLYWRGASTAGAYAGLLCGLLAIGGHPAVRKAFGYVDVPGHIAGIVAIVASLVVMVVVSLIAPDRERAGDPKDAAGKGGAA